MNAIPSPVDEAKAPAQPTRPHAGKPRNHMALRLDRTGPDARRQATAVLEVLAGARTPTDAAKALGVSLVAYYNLEGRALKGLVKGCEPPGRGPRPSTDAELSRLRRECGRLQRDAARYQALARATQRAAGLAAPAAGPKTDAGGRRKRRPSVRALKAARTIRQQPEPAPEPATAPVPPIERGAP